MKNVWIIIYTDIRTEGTDLDKCMDPPFAHHWAMPRLDKAGIPHHILVWTKAVLNLLREDDNDSEHLIENHILDFNENSKCYESIVKRGNTVTLTLGFTRDFQRLLEGTLNQLCRGFLEDLIKVPYVKRQFGNGTNLMTYINQSSTKDLDVKIGGLCNIKSSWTMSLDKPPIFKIVCTKEKSTLVSPFITCAACKKPLLQ